MKHITKTLSFIAAMLVANNSQALIIDSFNDTSQSVSSGGSITNTVAASEALGGFRQLDILSSTGPGITAANVFATASLGIFAHNENSFTSGSSRITWNANGAGLGVDLTANNAFILDTLTIDQGSMDVTIGITDNNSTDFVTLSNITNSNSLPTISFYSFSGIDFNLIDEIYLEIDAGQASDITLDEIRTMGDSFITVPEPATFVLMGAGLLGMIGMRRRNAAR